MPGWAKFWLDVKNEGSDDDDSLKMEMQLDQEKSPKKIRKVIHQRAGVTEGVIAVELPSYMRVGRKLETDREGEIINPKNKTHVAKKERLAGNKRDKGGHIARDIDEDYWSYVGRNDSKNKFF